MSGIPKVTVLMASFNGERYIQEQLNSVLASSGVAVDLIVRDDGSSDSTADILAGYGDRVTFLKKDSADKSYGHLANFSALCNYALEKTDSDYYAFCDQDDVWFPEKLGTLIEHIKRIENGGATPSLVHCDLRVVDANLNVLSESFWRYQGLPNPAEQRVNRLMYQNVVTGCACLFNRALLRKACPIPKEAIVHDFWFALVAESIGKVAFVDKPLLDYRQHGENSIGSVSFKDQRSYFKKFFYRTLWRFPSNLARTQLQTQALLKRFGNELELKELLISFAYLHKHNAIRRIKQGSKLLQSDKRSFGERLYLAIVFFRLKHIHKRLNHQND